MPQLVEESCQYLNLPPPRGWLWLCCRKEHYSPLWHLVLHILQSPTVNQFQPHVCTVKTDHQSVTYGSLGFHCYHSRERYWGGVQGDGPHASLLLQHWQGSPKWEEEWLKQWLKSRSSYMISGVASISKHELLPHHNPHLVTQVVKPVRLVKPTSPIL